MKFTLLVVGRTVEKHYITAINDYVERTKHFFLSIWKSSPSSKYQKPEYGATKRRKEN